MMNLSEIHWTMHDLLNVLWNFINFVSFLGRSNAALFSEPIMTRWASFMTHAGFASDPFYPFTNMDQL